MFRIILLFAAMMVASFGFSQSTFVIPGNSSIEIDIPNYELYGAMIKNKSVNELGVSVVNKESNEKVKGFGLNAKAKDIISVAGPNKLVLSNTSSSPIKVKVGFKEQDPEKFVRAPGNYVSFTLQNKSNSSIPLIIPNVMNPNLSPNSKSGVDLEIGQEIYFKNGSKKYTLLVVDESLKDGDIVIVNELIQQRIEELGLE